MHRKLWRRAAAPLTALLLAATPACSAVKEAVGQFSGNHQRVVLVIDRGYGTPDELIRAITPTVQATVDEGGRLSAYVVGGGSVGALQPVVFADDAGGGDFDPPGSNRDAWREAARTFQHAVLRDLAEAIEKAPTSSTGSDLVGSLNRAIDELTSAGSGRPRIAVLVTGGGVHRTEAVDLVNPPVTPATAAELAAQVPLRLDPSIDVRVIGVGSFPEVDPPLSIEFVDGVEAFWAALCAPASRTCHIHANAPTD